MVYWQRGVQRLAHGLQDAAAQGIHLAISLAHACEGARDAFKELCRVTQLGRVHRSHKRQHRLAQVQLLGDGDENVAEVPPQAHAVLLREVEVGPGGLEALQLTWRRIA